MLLNSCPANVEGETPKEDKSELDEYITRPGGTVTSRKPLQVCSKCSISTPLLWHRSFLGSTWRCAQSVGLGGEALAVDTLKSPATAVGRAAEGEP